MAIIRVVFEWDDRFGRCYECGVPAAYESTENASQPESLRCSVCAARDAAGGAKITYLFPEEPANWPGEERFTQS